MRPAQESTWVDLSGCWPVAFGGHPIPMLVPGAAADVDCTGHELVVVDLEDAGADGFAFPRNAAPGRPAPRHRRAQRGVEFLVEDAQGFERSFRSFNDAAGFAVGVAAASNRPVLLDVLVMTRDGAAERIQITAKSVR